MHQALKDAITICKTFLRNGYDAHVINAPLQEHLLRQGGVPAVDIACEPDLDTLVRLFPAAVPERESAPCRHGAGRRHLPFLSAGGGRRPGTRSFPCCALPPP